MNLGKAAGPFEVAMELIKTTGERGEEWVLEMTHKIVEEMKIPKGWKKSEPMLIYKTNSDVKTIGE